MAEYTVVAPKNEIRVVAEDEDDAILICEDNHDEDDDMVSVHWDDVPKLIEALQTALKNRFVE